MVISNVEMIYWNCIQPRTVIPSLPHRSAKCAYWISASLIGVSTQPSWKGATIWSRSKGLEMENTIPNMAHPIWMCGDAPWTRQCACWLLAWHEEHFWNFLNQFMAIYLDSILIYPKNMVLWRCMWRKPHSSKSQDPQGTLKKFSECKTSTENATIGVTVEDLSVRPAQRMPLLKPCSSCIMRKWWLQG